MRMIVLMLMEEVGLVSMLVMYCRSEICCMPCSYHQEMMLLSRLLMRWGNIGNFVQRMNVFAYNLHLFQTHYSNPDGLTLDDAPHYTTGNDLLRLAQDAMQIPLFAQIVNTRSLFHCRDSSSWGVYLVYNR